MLIEAFWCFGAALETNRAPVDGRRPAPFVAAANCATGSCEPAAGRGQSSKSARSRAGGSFALQRVWVSTASKALGLAGADRALARHPNSRVMHSRGNQSIPLDLINHSIAPRADWRADSRRSCAFASASIATQMSCRIKTTSASSLFLALLCVQQLRSTKRRVSSKVPFAPLPLPWPSPRALHVRASQSTALKSGQRLLTFRPFECSSGRRVLVHSSGFVQVNERANLRRHKQTNGRTDEPAPTRRVASSSSSLVRRAGSINERERK